MKSIARIFWCMIALVSVSGCYTKSVVLPMDERVTIAPDLSGDAYVKDMRCEKVSGSGLLTLQANLMNLTDDPVAVDWRVQWLDAGGFEIDSVVSSWNSVMLQPCELRGLKATAHHMEAADMRFYVRRARR